MGQMWYKNSTLQYTDMVKPTTWEDMDVIITEMVIYPILIGEDLEDVKWGFLMI